MERAIPLTEAIISATARQAAASAWAGVEVYTFVSEPCGATGFSTGIARFKPEAYLPYHSHPFSEAVTVLEGHARVLVEGRQYRLTPGDCVHFPAGAVHQVENYEQSGELVAHWAFATARPTRDVIDRTFPIEDHGFGNPSAKDPETLVRYQADAAYELSKEAYFFDLFARRLGAIGICGGHGRFLPGASLPCHIHDFDESITIVKGVAVCLVEGKRYELSNYDTAFIPKGRPHRFLNLSEDEMAMVWVYAGSEPDRQIVGLDYCSGKLAWPGAQLAQVEKPQSV